MNQYYAISEALVVIAGCYSAFKFIENRQNAIALACALFALAAAIGTIKFGLNLKSELGKAHSIATQFGGLFASGLILAQFIYFGKSRFSFWQSIALAAILTLVGFFVPVAGALIFVISLAYCFLVLSYQAIKSKSNLLGPICFGIMLINVLLIRNSPLLGKDISFLSFHVLIALWLVLLPKALKNHNSLVRATSSI